MKTINTYVTHYQRQIVLNSSVIDRPEYKSLKQLLERHQKIDLTILDKDECADQDTKDIVIYAFDNLYQIARSEWTAVKQNEIGSIRCSLCNEPNKLIYFIKNKINGNTLNVGSSCIQHFTDLRFQDGRSIKKVILEAKKSNDAVNRKVEFNKMYPGLDGKIQKYRKALDKSPFLLPENIYSSLNKKIQDITDFRSRYLTGKISRNLLSSLQNNIVDCDSYMSSEVSDWLASAHDEEFICTLSAKEWLEGHNNLAIVDKIRDQGSILSSDTIPYVSYPPFIQEKLPLFRTYLSELFITIELYRNNVYVTCNERNLSDLIFKCTPAAFMKHFGISLFGDINIPSLKKCLRSIILLDEDPSVQMSLIKRLNTIFRFKYQFLYDQNTEKVYIISDERGQIVSIGGLTNITQYLLPCVIGENYSLHAETTYFKNIKTWKPIEDFDSEDLSRLRIENRFQ